MRKLTVVEEAKVLMDRAKDWPVWRWLMEKKRVRHAADTANAALDQLLEDVRASWPEDLRKAYRHPAKARDLDAETRRAVERAKEAAEAAYAARMDAENTFEEAEKRLSTSMAREGARKAMDSWDLYEKAIRKTEALLRRKEK
jgi:hypothetical protein